MHRRDPALRRSRCAASRARRSVRVRRRRAHRAAVSLVHRSTRRRTSRSASSPFRCSCSVPLTPSLTIDVGTSYARSHVEQTGCGKTTTSEISGLTDTQIRGHYVIGTDFIVLTAGVNIPTGQSTVIAESKLVAASLIGSDFLSFPISNMGTGLRRHGRHRARPAARRVEPRRRRERAALGAVRSVRRRRRRRAALSAGERIPRPRRRRSRSWHGPRNARA